MRKKVVIGISMLIVFSAMILVMLYIKTDNRVTINYSDDEIKFKNEYEKYNGIEDEDNVLLKIIDINNDNNFVYLNDDNILDYLKKGTNIIYLGWPDNNYCRVVVPLLIDIVKKNNINTLYYYNFKELRNGFLNGNESSIDLYNSIIDIIGDSINMFFDSTEIKSIISPTIIFIKNGEFIGLSSFSNELDIDNVTNEDEVNIIQEYQTYIDILNSNVCLENTKC